MASAIKSLFKRVIPPAIWSRMHDWRVQRSVATYARHEVRHTYGGFPLTVHLADPLGAGWYDHDWDFPQEFTVLGEGQLKPGARVFDLGAHQGVVALMLSRIVGPTGSVVALEALPHNAGVAEKNRTLNGASNLTIRQAAISDTTGTIEFRAGLNGHIQSGGENVAMVQVPTLTIDGLTAQYGQPQVLYIDVEGFEARALAAATDTLKGRPDVFVEMHVGCGLERFGGSVDDVLAFFPESDYERFMATEKEPKFVPFDRSSPVTRDRFFLVARRIAPR